MATFPGLPPGRRLNDVRNEDWRGPGWKRWSEGPEQIAVICKEVKGIGTSGRTTEREFGWRGRV